MKETFTIPQDNRERVEKLVARFGKKAAKYNKLLTVEYGAPYAERRPVWAKDHETHTLSKIGETMVEVFDLTIEGEIIQQDGYTVVAKIEHLENGNLVTPIVGEVKPEWRTAACNCDHCNMKRRRTLTFIVRHENGTEKQIGRACLKDYCGIDPQLIGIANQLHDLVMNEDVVYYDFHEHPVSRVHLMIDALAAAIHVYKVQGYVKSSENNSNRGKMFECMKENTATKADREAARNMIEAVKEVSEEDAINFLLDKVQVLAKDGYCKDSHFGIIAYAPAAYARYLEAMKKQAEREAAKMTERQASKYVGQVGKRIDIEIADTKLLTTIETQWGYTFLYKFTDINGNVLVWFASNRLGRWNENGAWEDVDSVKSLRATVKEHSERDGVKQTILTRCKAA